MNWEEHFMRIALAEAKAALTAGEVPIGAVLVMEGEILAKDHNRTEALSDPTAHAELLCISAATASLGAKYLPAATLYVTLEPCAMCAGALAWARVGEIVFAAPDPLRGFLRYQPSLPHPRTRWRQGPFGEEALQLLRRFFHERRQLR